MTKLDNHIAEADRIQSDTNGTLDSKSMGLNRLDTPIAITPDGQWMAYHYGTQLGQLYRSDNLK